MLLMELGKRKQWGEMYKYYHEMLDLNLTPNIKIFTFLVKFAGKEEREGGKEKAGWGEGGMWGVDEVLGEMERLGVEGDGVFKRQVKGVMKERERGRGKGKGKRFFGKGGNKKDNGGKKKFYQKKEQQQQQQQQQ